MPTSPQEHPRYITPDFPDGQFNLEALDGGWQGRFCWAASGYPLAHCPGSANALMIAVGAPVECCSAVE